MFWIIPLETAVSMLMCCGRKVWTGFRQHDQNIEVQIELSPTAALGMMHLINVSETDKLLFVSRCYCSLNPFSPSFLETLHPFCLDVIVGWPMSTYQDTGSLSYPSVDAHQVFSKPANDKTELMYFCLYRLVPGVCYSITWCIVE